MKFTKMQALGNDYVYVNGFEETVEKKSEMARFVSDRHFGIGSDGLIFINPSKVADFEMEMYNADGSRAEMCGNGIRSLGKYVYDKGLTDKTTITVETLAGIMGLELMLKDGKVGLVKVDMGEPILEASQIPMTGPQAETKEAVIGEHLEVNGTTYVMTAVSMGNPHAVVFRDEEIANLDLEKIGPDFEYHKRFPNRVNTEFVNVIDEDTLSMRVWERGSGETLACGTGACAVAVAGALNGFTKNKVTVKLRGGDLHIEWKKENNRVYMTGPAVTVFEGEMEYVYD